MDKGDERKQREADNKQETRKSKEKKRNKDKEENEEACKGNWLESCAPETIFGRQIKTSSGDGDTNLPRGPRASCIDGHFQWQKWILASRNCPSCTGSSGARAGWRLSRQLEVPRLGRPDLSKVPSSQMVPWLDFSELGRLSVLSPSRPFFSLPLIDFSLSVSSSRFFRPSLFLVFPLFPSVLFSSFCFAFSSVPLRVSPGTGGSS